MQVGDIVYRFFDYGKRPWSKNWFPLRIVTQTQRNWILERGYKIPKKGPLMSNYARSMKEIAFLEWAKDNRDLIADTVRRLPNFKLAEVAAFLNYIPKVPSYD